MPNGGRRSLLIVDDVEDLRMIVRFAVSAADGWHVIGEAGNGVEAIDAARRDQPDVVLLDLEMPWMDGAESLPHIRKVSPNTRVVIWTVEPHGARAASARDLGALGVLDKTSTPPHELVAELDRLLAAG